MGHYRRDDEDMWMSITMIIVLLGAVFIVFQLTGCVSAPVKPVEKATCASGSWCYDELVKEHLPPALMSAYFGDLCPSGADPKKFWPALMKATAYYESSYKVDTRFKERFNDSAGNAQWSQGLFQLSLDDARRGVAECKEITQATILEAEPNILCAIGIMDQLVLKNQFNTMRGALGRYWSTIRDKKVDAKLKEFIPECFSERPPLMQQAGV
jgi:hypothetical protein